MVGLHEGPNASNDMIVDALHIYNVANLSDGERESSFSVVWSPDGMKCALSTAMSMLHLILVQDASKSQLGLKQLADTLPVMEIHLREAGPADVDFARSLYFETMRGMIESLFGWDQCHQEESFGKWFDLHEASIIVADGNDVGWMQIRKNEQKVFLGSLYVKPEMQRRGIGTHVLRELITRCQRSSKTLTLAVMKANPAIHLYERLGFRVTHDDQYKFYMLSE